MNYLTDTMIRLSHGPHKSSASRHGPAGHPEVCVPGPNSSQRPSKTAKAKTPEKPAPAAVLRKPRKPSARLTGPRLVKAAALGPMQREVLMAALTELPGTIAKGHIAGLRRRERDPSFVVKEPSLLITHDGFREQREIRSPCVQNGTFKKFRYTLKPNGQVGGLWEYRLKERFQRDLQKLKQRRQVLLDAGKTAEARALKLKTWVIAYDAPDDPDDILRELKMLHDANSPLRSQGWLQMDGRFFVRTQAMQADGFSIAEEEKLSGEERRASAHSMFRQIASRVKGLHAKGIIHRDLKPQNFLVRVDGQAQGIYELCDFGFATHLNNHGMATGYKGSPEYMAPEIYRYRNEFYGPSVDMYSLGISVAVHARRAYPIPRIEGETENHFYDRAYKTLLGYLAHAPQNSRGEVTLGQPLLGKLKSIDKHVQELSTYYNDWFQDNPKLATFVVNKMVPMDPKKRANATEVAEFARTLQPENSEARKLADAVAAGVVERSKYYERIALLKAYEKAYASGPMGE